MFKLQDNNDVLAWPWTVLKVHGLGLGLEVSGLGLGLMTCGLINITATRQCLTLRAQNMHDRPMHV